MQAAKSLGSLNIQHCPQRHHGRLAKPRLNIQWRKRRTVALSFIGSWGLDVSLPIFHSVVHVLAGEEVLHFVAAPFEALAEAVEEIRHALEGFAGMGIALVGIAP